MHGEGAEVARDSGVRRRRYEHVAEARGVGGGGGTGREMQGIESHHAEDDEHYES